jgi:hypothetical protein
MNFQEYGTPCTHAIVACRYEAEDPIEYFGMAFTMESYRQTYKHFVIPINIENLESTAGIQPPQFKKQRGRPKAKRIRKGAWKRKAICCRNCNGTGHNTRTCKSAPALNGRQQRRRDRQEIEDYIEELNDEGNNDSDEERLTEFAEYLAQNCDSDSELSDLDRDSFGSIEGDTEGDTEGVEMEGVELGSNVELESDSEMIEVNYEGLQQGTSKVMSSPPRTTRSGRKYSKKGL